MSRAKFEEWARSKGYDLDKWEEEFESFLTVAAHEGWLAGRESMRDEAAAFLTPKRPRSCDCDICDCQNSGDLQDVTSWDSDMRAANAIKAIEP